jgi:autoinducer 2-degrading protein
VLSLSVTLQIREERIPEFLAALGENRRGSLQDEPGCLQFDIGRDVDHPDVFHLYEVYRDDDALEKHRSAPHFERWRQAAGDFIVEGGRASRTSQLVAFGGDKPKGVSP